jgi:hypothetical protein
MGVRFRGHSAGLLSDGVVLGVMGRLRGLVLRVFSRLASLGSGSATSFKDLHTRTSRPMTTFLVRCVRSDPNEELEGPDFSWDGDVIEEELWGWVTALGGSVGGVLHTQDILCVYKPTAILW